MAPDQSLPEINAEDIAPGATAALSAFAASLSYDDIPSEVVSYVKELILDNIGVVLLGNQTDWAKMLMEMGEEPGATPRSTIMGCGTKTSAALAALVNATGGHSFEFDEIHRDSGLHPGSIIVPVVLALAESEGGYTGRDLITATVAAYEVGCRVGMSTGPGLFYRGHHPQGSVGVFAAATAASRILRLDAAQTQNALGTAGSAAAGLMAAQEGAMVKRMHAGMSAQNGIYGAILARKGFAGIHNVLEASFGGFIQSFTSTPQPEHLTKDLGIRWETLYVGYKPYPTVASIHTALDGLRGIMQDNSLTAEDIEKIDVGCSNVTYRHCAWEYKPIGVTSAQMNLFYCLAVVAADGDARVDHFKEDRLRDPKLLELISRMEAHVDDELEAMGRKFRHSALLRVLTRDGRVFEARELHRRGSAENPARPGDIEKKFRMCAGAALGEDAVERILGYIQDLEARPSLDELFGLLQGKRRAGLE